MNKVWIIAATLLFVTACSPADKKEEAGKVPPDAPGAQADAPKRDISTEALVKIDPAIQEYEDRLQTAKTAYDEDESVKNTEALIGAHMSFADYMTYESSVSPREGKYHRALIEYRHALELDPANEKAQVEIAQIEDIYRSMNRPVPGEE
jgi:tetratricopeptide (TPR) repeat protein